MSSSASIRHTVGIDVFRPLSVTALISIMTPLILLPLGSIFFFGTNKGLSNFWSALVEPDAIFA
ncbi:MAG TPA: hypothetical protein VFC63_13965, partial [Blastocatellia bacterium]|nr:hypothetical protein [Blastocatellia bacterium]